MASPTRDRLLEVGGFVLAGGLGLAVMGHCLVGPCALAGAQAAVAVAAPSAAKTVQKSAGVRTDSFAIKGMFCADCARRVTVAVSKTPGVKAVDVDYQTGKGSITYDPGKVDAARLIQAIKKAGYQAKMT